MAKPLRNNNADLKAIIPDMVSLTERIKVVPDTRVERILYKMLLDQMQENELLKFRIKQLTNRRNELARKRDVRRKIKSALSEPLKASALDHPAQKGEGL